MSQYGCALTKKGRELITRVLATKETLIITRVMVGSGKCPDDTYMGDLESLVQPVAAGTSTTPVYDEDTIEMVVEYRSDLNGGLDVGFWLNEFAVFARGEEDQTEVMLYYGSLGDYPQWVSPYSNGGIDVRRYPISIHIGEGATIMVDYSAEAFMTAEDVAEYVTVTLLPQLLEEAKKLIEEHNQDPEAHSSIQTTVSNLDGRIALLELMYNTDVSGNPFNVTFEDLEGLSVTGVWNKTKAQIEF